MVRLTVRTHPRSSRSRLRWDGHTLDAWVSAPPVDGAANLAVISTIAAWLGVPPSAIRLFAGHRSRTKVIEVEGLTTFPSWGQIPPSA